MDVLPGIHFTDEKHTVHQADPSQHFSALELRKLFAKVRGVVLIGWQEEVDFDPQAIYDFHGLQCAMDGKGLWYRMTPRGYQWPNLSDMAFWYTKRQINRAALEDVQIQAWLLQARIEQSEESDQLRIVERLPEILTLHVDQRYKAA